MFSQFIRPQSNTESTQRTGRGEAPRPAGFIKLVGERDARAQAEEAATQAVPQADGSA